MNSSAENLIDGLNTAEISNLLLFLQRAYDKKKQNLESIPTLFKFYQEYLKFIEASFSEKYLRSVKQSFNHLLKFFDEGSPISEISIKQAELFRIKLMKNAPRGCFVYFRTIKAAFNKAIVWEYISNNPFAKIKFKKPQHIKPLYINRSELQNIIDKTDDNKMKNIFLFAFNTGCRLGEINTLKWTNIDFKKEMITIGDAEFRTKSGKQRFLPFNHETKQLLSMLYKQKRKSYQFVFCKNDGFPYHKDYISRNFKKAVRKADMDERIHFHTLRHSFASNLANKGVSLVVIQELMGHSSLLVTQIYAHTNLENLRSGICKLEAA